MTDAKNNKAISCLKAKSVEDLLSWPNDDFRELLNKFTKHCFLCFRCVQNELLQSFRTPIPKKIYHVKSFPLKLNLQVRRKKPAVKRESFRPFRSRGSPYG